MLFPPHAAKHLQPYGTLDTIHPNGLIRYKDAIVRSDGLSRRIAAQARVDAIGHQMEVVLEGAEKGKGKGKQRETDDAMEVLHKAHNQALDELLKVTMDDRSAFDEEDDFDMLGDEFKDEYEDDDSDEEFDEGSEDDEEGPIFEDDTGSVDRDDPKPSKEPSSFSRVPPAYLHQHLGLPTTAKLPPDIADQSFDLSKAPSPYLVEIQQGQMLYLPASWWHEVTSASKQVTEGDSEERDDVHMAFNYWFYPPDALDSFEEPYADASTWEYLRKESMDIAERAVQRLAESDRGKRKRDSDAGPRTKRTRN